MSFFADEDDIARIAAGFSLPSRLAKLLADRQAEEQEQIESDPPQNPCNGREWYQISACWPCAMCRSAGSTTIRRGPLTVL